MKSTLRSSWFSPATILLAGLVLTMPFNLPAEEGHIVVATDPVTTKKATAALKQAPSIKVLADIPRVAAAGVTAEGSFPQSSPEYQTVYFCLLAVPKTGWNATTKEYYDLPKIIIVTPIYKMTGMPESYRPDAYIAPPSSLPDTLSNHLAKKYGIAAGDYSVRWAEDYREKEFSEQLAGALKDYLDDGYTIKLAPGFSFTHRDNQFSVSVSPVQP